MIETLSLPPYFHPTTVCLVDDNESFLRSLSLEIPENLAFRGFTDPQVALDLVNRKLSLPPLVDRCVSMEHQLVRCRRRFGKACFVNLGKVAPRD